MSGPDLCGVCMEPTNEDGTCDCPPLPYEQTYDGLKERLAVAEAIVSRLPIHADTGQAFIFGRRVAWIIDDGFAFSVDRVLWTSIGWMFIYRRYDLPPGQEHDRERYSKGPAYSTEAAAIAAKEIK